MDVLSSWILLCWHLDEGMDVAVRARLWASQGSLWIRLCGHSRSVKFILEASTYLKGQGDSCQQRGFPGGTPRFLLFELRNARPSRPPTDNPAVISGGKLFHHHFKQIHFFKSNTADWTSVFGNTINIVITTLLWSFCCPQENRKSDSLVF